MQYVCRQLRAETKSVLLSCNEIDFHGSFFDFVDRCATHYKDALRSISLDHGCGVHAVIDFCFAHPAVRAKVRVSSLAFTSSLFLQAIGVGLGIRRACRGIAYTEEEDGLSQELLEGPRLRSQRSGILEIARFTCVCFRGARSVKQINAPNCRFVSPHRFDEGRLRINLDQASYRHQKEMLAIFGSPGGLTEEIRRWHNEGI